MNDESKEQNLINEKLDRVLESLLQHDKKIAKLQNDIDIMLKKIQNYYSELNFADLFHDTINNSAWLKDKSFSLHGWAANYSFIYMLYRILNNAKPGHILEMGMGQTSRLTSQYIAYCNSGATLDIIENDFGWISTYQPQLAQSERIKVHLCDLDIFVHENTECRKYKKLNEVIGGKKYDLIIIDGPYGGNQTMPRSNILEIIKNGNLADDFIIVFDDTERQGEQNTVKETLNILKEQNISFIMFSREGIKTQTYITSLTKSFVQYL